MKKSPWLKLLVAFGLIAVLAYFFIHHEIASTGKGAVVYFPKGSSVSQIAETLEQQGLIHHAWSFKFLVRFKGEESKLHPGEYDIKPGMTASDILEKLVKGERIVHKLVIPEGFTFKQIAEAIEKTGIAPATQVQTYFRDPQLLQSLGFPALSLEGFLFPATYEYDRMTTVDELLKKMIQAFKLNFDSSLREQTLAQGWTIPQTVTLASII